LNIQNQISIESYSEISIRIFSVRIIFFADQRNKKLQSSAKLSWPRKSRRKGLGENKTKRERKERKMVKN
jgi:hypothetical protein